MIGGLVAVFCLRAGAHPFWVAARYVEILAVHHTGEAILAGISELRPLIYQLVTDVSEVDAIAGSIALGLIGGYLRGRISGRGRQKARAVRGAAARRVLVADDVLPPHLRVRDSAAGDDAAGAERRAALAPATGAVLAAAARHDVRHPGPEPPRRARRTRRSSRTSSRTPIAR